MERELYNKLVGPPDILLFSFGPPTKMFAHPWAKMIEFFRGFAQSLQDNVGIVP
jgi:hypothetical protein